MKKILFAAYSLDYGGIETALLTLLKELHNKYEITLSLEEKQGVYLNQVPEDVNIIVFKPNKNKIILLRKVINFIKQFKFKLKYKNKFDFSACFATYSLPASFVARTTSKNCAIWIHNNYMDSYNQDIIKYRKLYKDIHIYNYKKIVFVSKIAAKIFTAQFPECSKRVLICNNLIDYEEILRKSKEKIDDLKKENITTFINIGRHDEKQKKLTRIISATEKLNKEGYKFRVIFVGKGTATNEYKKFAKNIKNIEFLGAKKNPYPYLKCSDAMILSSDYEGYPVVFVEAKILGKPIITTDVSDSKKDIADKFGIVVEKSEEGIYEGMKQFIENGFIPEKFDSRKYNDEILKTLEKIINN